MPKDTGLPQTDAQFDFNRQRRRRAGSRLAARLRGGDVDLNLPYEEVVAALGYRGERSLGLQVIDLDTIVGTVDRGREFDRSFRPTSGRVRRRWEGIAEAIRRGQSMPPIDVYRIGEMHFVRDGHHRVSVARAMGLDKIDAYVTEIVTAVGADQRTRLRDLALKSHERLFFERVPLPPGSRPQIQLADEWRYAELAESVEAWGFRAMQGLGEFMTREEVAERWFRDEYDPVVNMLGMATVSAQVRKPRLTFGARACATCRCGPTSGATMWWNASASSSANPRATRTRWCTGCGRSFASSTRSRRSGGSGRSPGRRSGWFGSRAKALLRRRARSGWRPRGGRRPGPPWRRAPLSRCPRAAHGAPRIRAAIPRPGSTRTSRRPAIPQGRSAS